MTRRDLEEDGSIDRLWRYAVARGRVADDLAERRRFWALCLYCAREGERPGALLTHCVFAGAAVEWRAHLADEDEAGRRLASRRGPVAPAAAGLAAALSVPVELSERPAPQTAGDRPRTRDEVSALLRARMEAGRAAAGR